MTKIETRKCVFFLSPQAADFSASAKYNTRFAEGDAEMVALVQHFCSGIDGDSGLTDSVPFLLSLVPDFLARAEYSTGLLTEDAKTAALVQ